MSRRFRAFTFLSVICLAVLSTHVVVRRCVPDALTPSPSLQEGSAHRLIGSDESSAALPLTVTENALAARLNEETSLVFVEAVWLSQILDRKQLDLDPATREAVAETIAGFQQVRRDYEAHICQLVHVDDRRVEIAVPSYSEVGYVMRDLFYAELEQRVGADRAAHILRELNGSIEEELGHFGRTAQRIAFSRENMDGSDLYLASSSGESTLSLSYVAPQLPDVEGLQAFLPHLAHGWTL